MVPSKTAATATGSGTLTTRRSDSSSPSGICPADLGKPARQENPDDLRRESWRGGNVDQHRPVARRQTGLLVQLTSGRGRRGLPFDVQQAGRQLPQPTSQRMAVLLEQDDRVVLVDRHHRHRVVVLDDLARGRPTTRHDDVIDPDSRDQPVVGEPRADHLEPPINIRARGPELRHRRALGHLAATGVGTPFWTASRSPAGAGLGSPVGTSTGPEGSPDAAPTPSTPATGSSVVAW